MAPFPLFFNIHTDSWGNHRIGDSSIPMTIGGFITDLWGSHRGGPILATTGERATRRSIECGQGVYWLLVKIFTIVPTWWNVIFVINLLVLFAIAFFFGSRAGSLQIRKNKTAHEGQRLVVKVIKIENKEEEEDMWV